MKVGNLIKQYLYNNRGQGIHRFGIVIKIISRKKIKVFWFIDHASSRRKTPYEETIKMELIEVISEIN